MKILAAPAFLLLALAFSCQKPITEVTICSTIHGAHQSNPNYTYKDLFAFIDSCNPDIIGVEIRNEDRDCTQVYLSRSYPFEMRELLLQFAHKPIYGFDWLGTEIEGKVIPKNYFKEMKVKKLSQKLQTDLAMLALMHNIDSLASLKNSMVLNASVMELNGERFDALNSTYYQELERVFKGTPYQHLSDFYRMRDEQISRNIIDIIKANPKKRLLFIMGGDHRSYTLTRLNEEFGEVILLNQVFKTKS